MSCAFKGIYLYLSTCLFVLQVAEEVSIKLETELQACKQRAAQVR